MTPYNEPATATASAHGTLTLKEAVNAAMRQEMERDPLVFLIGEDVGPYGGEMGQTKGLWDTFGEMRVRDAPIAEEAILGCALGAALTGCRPIAEIPFSDFTVNAMDMIVNQAAKMRYMFGGNTQVPLVVRTVTGGYIQAGAQHSQSLEAWFAHVPGLKVVYPSTPADAKGLLAASIRTDDPVIFFEHKKLYDTRGPVPPGESTIPLGVADVKRQGGDLSVIATGVLVHMALEVANALAAEGVSLEVIDLRSLVPLDFEQVAASVAKTGRVVVAMEAPQRGSFANYVAARIAEECWQDLRAAPRCVGARDAPVPLHPKLEAHVLPSTDTLTAAVRATLRDRRTPRGA
jgi:acetoin:2,6-dichlorophenolindophenol oxidoreductase subunit beta